MGGIALLGVLLAIVAVGAPASAASAPRDMVERLLSAPLPGRDPLDLAVRLRGVPATTPLVAPVVTSALPTGTQQTFSVLDQRSARYFQIQATLREVTDHAYWFVQNDLAAEAQQADLDASASVFEHRTYPLIHRYFGSEPEPGVDGDPHIVLLLANVPSVAAYFSSADAYPKAINPRSNEHKMIYANLNAIRPGQSAFDATITHELQHMAHFARCPAQEGWVDEGASELATRIAGYDGGSPQAFASRPDVQLDAWSPQTADVLRHYQAAYLFLRYVAERAGGWDALPRILSTCARGEGLFAAFLQQQPIAPDVDSLFADWTVANLVQDPNAGDGRFAYAGSSFHAAVTGQVTRETPFLGQVPQFAANYITLPTGPGNLTFSGDASVALLGAPGDDPVWWSNRGDSLDSRLTRQLDLRSVSEATLRFRSWYDLEDQFDFVYLSVSRDGGSTWQVLPARHTVPDRATGNNYGVGWTGSSGNTWLDEEVDLTPFAGSQVLLRLEYVTDQSYNGQGFALKDVEVPQLGLQELGASEAAWDSTEGWLLVDAPVPEHWNLRLVRWLADGVHVDPLPVGPDGSASVRLDDSASRSVLVVAPTAPRTLLPANYTVSIGD